MAIMAAFRENEGRFVIPKGRYISNLFPFPNFLPFPLKILEDLQYFVPSLTWNTLTVALPRSNLYIIYFICLLILHA